MTCRDFPDLDFALDHPTGDYFKGWSGKDFDAAQAWVSACTQAPPSRQDETRQTLLAQRRDALARSGETAHNEQTHAATRETDIQNHAEEEAASRAANAAAVTDAAARQAARAQCTQSAAYQRYLAAAQVVDALSRESEARQLLEREKRVEELSGATDLETKYSAGQRLVGAQEDERRWWTVYRQSGGNAPNPQALVGTAGNPCA